MPTYDDANIFAKMLRGEIPAYKVHEDDKSLAFLDIMPRAPGHTLVIPKSKARNILDVAPDDLAHLIKVTQKIARAAMTTFGAEGVTITSFRAKRAPPSSPLRANAKSPKRSPNRQSGSPPH